jgi:bifunctional DNA-binding transcriptional regulator/antitoxin component of YhaV-PrlF toxin-antitoxin module
MNPQDMYNRFNKIINKTKSLGSTRWGRKEVVDKILSAYMARDVQLPTLIREKRGFKKFTPVDVIRRIEEHLITIKESKLSQEMSKMHEQLEKNKGVVLKASNKERKSSSSTSKTMVKEDSDENMTPEQMALFIRKFNKVIKKSGFFNKNKKRTRSRPRRLPRGHALGLARRVTSLRSAPTSK